jgi:hypothetical protein
MAQDIVNRTRTVPEYVPPWIGFVDFLGGKALVVTIVPFTNFFSHGVRRCLGVYIK